MHSWPRAMRQQIQQTYECRYVFAQACRVAHRKLAATATVIEEVQKQTQIRTYIQTYTHTQMQAHE